MDQLLVALDVDSAARAGELAEGLQGLAGGFKIGSELFTAAGPDVVRALVARGHRVFLDLKFHDIPQTVAAAVAKAVEWGVFMLDLHVAGGREMMRAAAEAVVERAEAVGIERPRLIGVTVLTSLTQGDLQALGIGWGVEEQTLALARLAKESGLDGVVTSPHEVRAIRRRFGPDLLVVTPGIRPKAAEPDDQRRIATAREAVRAGADYVVVGRPILTAADPVEAAEQLVAEMETP